MHRLNAVTNILFLLVFVLAIASGCSLFKESSQEISKPEMISIQGGTFIMGDIYGDENPDATPVHTVTLSDFKIGKYEVTYKEYDAFARYTDAPCPRPTHWAEVSVP